MLRVPFPALLWRTGARSCTGLHCLVGDSKPGDLAAPSTRELTVAEKLETGLYLVATPIGNLEDITLRALKVLRSVDLILAEDTRHSAKLLQHYNIQTGKMLSYHKFNENSRQETILDRLVTGQALALISDAGMPGISDPGAELVRACVESNIKVVPVPGPSAAITALVAAGLPTNEFSFLGFLSNHASTRHKRLTAAAGQTCTQIIYVPPHKLSNIISECIVAFGPKRRCVVARELTKIHEEFWRGSLEQAQNEFHEREPKGEVTLLVEGAAVSSSEELPTEEEVEERLQILFDDGKSMSQAVKQVTEETFVKRNAVYSIALKVMKKQREQAAANGEED